MNEDPSFGTIVKERRNELGLTQTELARRVGCAPVTIRKIEYDALRPSVQIAEHLAVALNIPEAEHLAFVRLARRERDPSPIPTPPPEPEEIGQKDLSGRALKGFQLGERIGAGGYGAVYRAVQATIERDVAIKIILPKYANQPEFIRRFEAEAQLVAQLEHPHVVPLYDYWREPGVAYLVMRFLRGGSLDDRLKDGPLAAEMLLPVLEQICAGLQAAHRAGVIHRDIKPANILLDEDGNAYLADFGIAKNLTAINGGQTTGEVVIGSPAYISPEQIMAEPVKPQTDIYSLGVMLYELLTGHKPFRGPTPVAYIQQHLNEQLPLLSAASNGDTVNEKQAVPTPLDVVIGRATSKDPQERYSDILSLLADVRRAMQPNSTVVDVTGSRTDTPTPAHIAAMIDLPDLENPYKGLRAFAEADAADFFGRDTLVQALLVRMAEESDLSRFLAVVGPSGSGKSSVVKAGLMPALRQGGLPDSEKWFIVEMIPGPHPLEELEAALLRVAVNPPDSLLAQLREDERGLLRAVNRILPADDETELVLVIDQFEEIFTLVDDEELRVHLLDSLVTAVLDNRSRIRIVITLRADFTDRPLQYVDFGELVRQQTEFVLPLTPDELESAITGPTKRAGLALEAGLVPTIIGDIGDQPGMLPLLQYALTELFERRKGRNLTLAAYQESGGVLGALARRAEELYTDLDEAGQEGTRQLFLRLVTLGEGTEDTRRRVLRSELSQLSVVRGQSSVDSEGAGEKGSEGAIVNRKSKIQNVIDRFGRYRLLTFDHDPLTRGPTIEVAHEALLREWTRLRGWLDESRSDVRLQRLLASAAEEWLGAGRDSGYLLRDARLDQFEDWAATTDVALTQNERTYLEDSLAARREREAEEEIRLQRELEAAQKLAEAEKRRAEVQAQAATNLRKRAVWLAGVGVIAVLLAIVAGVFGVQSSQNAEQAVNAQLTAESRRLDAEREARRAKSGQLVLQSQAMLDNNEDPSGSLPLMLAREAVLTTLTADGYFTTEADAALRQAIEAVPSWRQTLPHPSVVNSAVFSPDGQRVLTAAGDGFVREWDVTSGEQTVSGEPHGGSLYAAAFSPDGKIIAVVGDYGYVSLRPDTLAGFIRDLKGHTAPVLSVAFSPDGKTLVTTSQEPDSTARLWDVATGQEIHRFEGHQRWVFDAAFSPDGQTVVTAAGDQTARLWDISTGEEILRFLGHTSVIDGVGLGGRTIATGVIDGVAFSPDGQMIVTASWDKTASLWDATTGEEIRQFIGHTGELRSVAFSPDGKTIVTSGDDFTVRLWDVATGAEIGRFDGHTDRVTTAAFSPDGQTIVTASQDQTVRLWDVNSGTKQDRIEHQGEVKSIAVSLDGNTIVTASNLPSGEVRLLDLKTGQEIHRLQGHMGEVTAVDISSDGQTVVTTGVDKTARLWDAASGEELLRLEGHEDFIFDVAFSPDGETVVTASADKSARVWDAASGKEITRFEGHTNQVRSAAFSPDGKTVVTSGGFRDLTARLWDAATGEEIGTLEGHEDILNSAEFSPDGQMIITASGDGTIRLWDVSTGQEIRRFEGHERGVNSAIFSPDTPEGTGGQPIVTTGSDQTVRVWDVTTGEEIRRLERHLGPVNAAVFSPDGKTIISASDDKTVRVWLGMDQLLDLAESLIQRDPPEFTPEERVRFGLE